MYGQNLDHRKEEKKEREGESGPRLLAGSMVHTRLSSFVSFLFVRRAQAGRPSIFTKRCLTKEKGGGWKGSTSLA